MNKRKVLEIEDVIENKLQTFASLLSRQDKIDWALVEEMDLEIQNNISMLNNLVKTVEDGKVLNDYSRHLNDYTREYQRIKVFKVI